MDSRKVGEKTVEEIERLNQEESKGKFVLKMIHQDNLAHKPRP